MINPDSLLFFIVIFYWTLKIYCVDILNIFLRYFKKLKLVIINILIKYSRKITQKKLAENSNFDLFM